MTVGELKKDIENLPDDGIVKIYTTEGSARIVEIHSDGKNYCINMETA